MIKLTGNQILEAMEKNGYELGRDWVTRSRDGKIISACILGQAAINLGWEPETFAYGISALDMSERDMFYNIISFNDESDEDQDGEEFYVHNWDQILTFARTQIDPDQVFEFKEELIKPLKESV